MDRNELIEKIERIDEDIYFNETFKPGTRASMVVVGASALLLCDLSKKNATKDVDVLRAEDCIRDALLKDKDFNDRCNAYSQCLPYNYEDRLLQIKLDTYVIDVWVPSVEDLTVMKLYRWEDPDKEDLTAEGFVARLNWDQLEHLVYSPDEAAASRISEPDNDRELKNLYFNYEEYKKGWKA